MSGKSLKYIAVLLGGAVIVLAVLFGTKNYEKRDTEVTESDTSAVITTSETEEDTDPTVSAIDAVNVDKLIDRYYSAKINNDVDELNNIVEAETEYNVADLTDETQFIEKYDDFTTYILPGLTDNYFIVYVKYNIYFNGISVGAPSLNHFIVAKEDDEHYYICDGSVSDEFRSYLEETEKSDTVLKLREQVETELEEACEKNEDLNYLIQILNEGAGETSEEAVVDTTAEETSQETQAEETTAESTSASE